VLFAVNFDFHLIDGDFFMSSIVRLKDVFQPIKTCLIASYDRLTNGPIRRYERLAWYETLREYTLLRRRVLTRKYFMLANLLSHVFEYLQLTNVPLLGRFLHAKIDPLSFCIVRFEQGSQLMSEWTESYASGTV
jgi:hypothetical protein